ncbi:hypothetical protein [Hymenobacter segetis]|uniref:Exosortase F system-associated protein n=1 Tax=Hymenobacter segetis TaxID=2025509 RepID=A0ABU9LTM8_9BACT
MKYALPVKHKGVLLLLSGMLLFGWYWALCVPSHRSLYEALRYIYHEGSRIGLLVESALFFLPAAAALLLYSSALFPAKRRIRTGAFLLLVVDTLLKSYIFFVLIAQQYFAFYSMDVRFLLPFPSTALLWVLFYITRKRERSV